MPVDSSDYHWHSVRTSRLPACLVVGEDDYDLSTILHHPVYTGLHIGTTSTPLKRLLDVGDCGNPNRLVQGHFSVPGVNHELWYRQTFEDAYDLNHSSGEFAPIHAPRYIAEQHQVRDRTVTAGEDKLVPQSSLSP